MRTITISESIKEEIARRVTEQQSAGYSVDAQGQWYVVDGAHVIHAQRNRPWNPWHDGADVIGVEDLVNIYGGADAERADFTNGEGGAEDFDITAEFALGYVPDSYDADDYEARNDG